MKTNLPLCVFDFETGNTDIANIQPIQIAAIIYDPIKLVEIPGARFCSMMKPWDLSKIEPKALEINKKTLKEVEEAPPIEMVWKKFVSFVQNYNKSTTKSWFEAPIPVGHNIIRFDLPIIEKLCTMYGPKDKKDNNQTLFNRMVQLDTLPLWYTWLMHTEIENMKLDSIRKYTDYSLDNAHDALVDCEFVGEFLLRFLSYNKIVLSKKNFIKGCFKK